MIPTKQAQVAFPGIEGFTVTVSHISREVSQKLATESTISKLDTKSRQPINEIDPKLFAQKFSVAAIKGWTGLKYKNLPELLLVDLSGVDDMEAEVEYSPENAEMLIQGSQGFDNWINGVVFSLDQFRD